MRTILTLVTVGLIFLSQPLLAADSLRCGTRLIQRNTLAIQVRERCGEPISKEIIGYTLRENRYANNLTRQRELKIEQWLYGPSNGYYDEIIFEGGRVKEINRIRR